MPNTWSSDGSRASVQALVDASTTLAGDTITIPVGTFTWSSQVNMSKGVTIQGSTTIAATYTNRGPTGMTANDQTIILDDIPRNGGSGGFAPLFYMTHTSGLARVSGLTMRFLNSTNGVVNAAGGTILTSANVQSPSNATNRIRVDHCHFDSLRNTYVGTVGGAAFGVVDHCLMDWTNAGTAIGQSFQYQLSDWGGVPFGDQAWAHATGFGTDQFLFVEDCVINNAAGGAQTIGATDSEAAGKIVVRYCRWQNCIVTDHGTANSGRLRSVRAKEIYNNTFRADRGVTGSGGLQRGGCSLVHDNNYEFVSPGQITGIVLTDFRSFDSFNYWGGATGHNPLDQNADTNDHTGNGLGGGPNGIFASGTVNANYSNLGGGLASISVAGAPWTINQWAPSGVISYSLNNTDTGKNGVIVSNTTNTITYVFYIASDEPAGSNPFTNGQHYAVYRMPSANIDQCGRGQGDLLTGTAPVINTVSGITSWPRNAAEPCYNWNNTMNGVSGAGFSSAVPNIVLNRDYFNNTAMPGYAPFVYPHPLVSGTTPPSPAISSSLTASGTTTVAFSYQITATNGPTSFNATPLPTGLSINTGSGIISGAPTTAGIYNITISATNSSGTGSAVLVLTIQTQVITLVPPVISSPTTASGIQNIVFNYQITATHTPTSFGATGLPTGLSINSGTGLISGTPTVVAVTNVTISATNTDGTGTAVLVITITAAAPTTVGRHPKKWKQSLLRRRQR